MPGPGPWIQAPGSLDPGAKDSGIQAKDSGIQALELKILESRLRTLDPRSRILDPRPRTLDFQAPGPRGRKKTPQTRYPEICRYICCAVR